MRTGTEGARRNINDQLVSTSAANHMEFQHQSQLMRPSKSLQDFQLTQKDHKALLEVREVCTQYILLKVAACHQDKLICKHTSPYPLTFQHPNVPISNTSQY